MTIDQITAACLEKGQMPLGDIFSAYADSLALICGNEKLSYSELRSAIGQLSAVLKTEGVQRGNRIAIVAANQSSLVTLFWSIWSVGAVAVPLSHRSTAAQIRHLTAQTGCSHFILDPETAGESPDLPIPRLKLPELIQRAAVGPVGEITGELLLDRAATIIMTSGSSGDPKAALHSLGNHVYSAFGSHDNIPVQRGDRWGLILPLSHVGGIAILFRCLLAGGTVQLPLPGESTDDFLQEGNLQHISMVSTQLHRLLKHQESIAPLRQMKTILLGGSAIPHRLIEQAIHEQLNVVLSYGCTEMSSQVTATQPGELINQGGSSGSLLRFRKLKIDESGQVLLGGRTLFQGYLNAPRSITADASGERWYASGDRGYIDESGHLHVLGRVDRMFISGGENIQPEEIEQALRRHAAVENAVVIPDADAEFGFRPAAFIKKKVSAEIRAADLTTFLEPQLERFKIPVRFYWWPDEMVREEMKILPGEFVKILQKKPQGLY